MGALSLVTRISLHMIVYQRPPIAKRAPSDVHHAIGELRLDSTSCHRKQLSICVSATTDQLRFPDVHQRRHDLHRPVRSISPRSTFLPSRCTLIHTSASHPQHHLDPRVALHPQPAGSQTGPRSSAAGDCNHAYHAELAQLSRTDRRLAGFVCSLSGRRFFRG